MTSYYKAKILGLCYNCRWRKPIEGKTRCQRCYDLARAAYLKRKADPDFRIANRARASKWVKENPGRRNVLTRRYRAKLREQALDHYGKVCACCGETEPLFLSVDHINGNGNKHREEIGRGGSAVHNWLIKNNFPDGFQILCFNCNCAKGFYGRCPHEDQDEESQSE